MYYVYLYGVSFVFILGLEIYLVISARKEQKKPDLSRKPETTQNNLSECKDTMGVSNLGYDDDLSQGSEPGKITIITHNYKRELSRTSNADDLFYVQTKDWSAPGNYRTSLYLRIAIIGEVASQFE